jgi:uncharacterized membrane protein
MKLNFNKHKWHIIIMVLCFVYAGVSLVVFAFQINSLVQAERIEQHRNEMVEFGLQLNESNFSEFNPRRPMNSNFSERGFLGDRRTNLFYPVIVVSLLGSVISILAGLSLMDLLRKKEKKELTKSVIDTMTTPEEKLVIKELGAAGGELTQSELVKKTNLSKVKVHRIVKRLEQLKVVSKYPYGVTNKIKLEKKVYHE